MGTHGTNPMELWGGQVELEKQTKKSRWNLNEGLLRCSDYEPLSGFHIVLYCFKKL